MSDTNQEVLDKYTKVCICRAISRYTIKKTIEKCAETQGVVTLEKVQKATLAGSGSCGGRRCTPKIIELLEEYQREKEQDS
ncbi:(2Fe-2S)-binding protein [Anaerocolumna cellulosilytica]|uniref:(2Fe-2S)-binding protein n=1 Tax=Anaerocolumna cellulosilytica TaxID=433286 RepID=A0A6S6R2Y9_9FIRM|nr:(2Fe-2S)-binding protein [Anaerocolumna cellulosilytica]MBB5195651.1 NAD(P)H-nitrite reductase large subunit [Anaerocolumna cellulosilytica]BCJ93895.1 (2Fe-2S)-binding protein [Anaerocolumna cellulosilytica]